MADIYIDADVAPEAEELLSDAVDYIHGFFPDWDASEANFEYILLGAIAFMISVAYRVTGLVPAAIFRWFGANLMNLPPISAAPASATATFTVKDNLGYTIRDGTVIGLVGPNEGEPFAVSGDLVIAAGSTTGDALLVAVNPGSAGSGLTDVDLTKGDSLDFVTSVVLDGVTQGGEDDEDDDAYLRRLSKRLELMAPRPILAVDFAEMAKDTAGVYRAVGLDGYNPDTNTWNNVGLVTVAVVSEDGSNVSAGTKDLVAADLESHREANFVVHVIDPTANGIDVEYVGTAEPGTDLNDVKARVNSALGDYLSKATWGTLPALGESPVWRNLAKVRYLEVATVIENVDGFDTLESLAIGVAGGARGQADINLNGAAPLAFLNVIIGGGTVNAP